MIKGLNSSQYSHRVMNVESNKTCPLLEQYLNYLSVIKARSECTIKEYRTDVLMFFTFVRSLRGVPLSENVFTFVDIDFIESINLNEMYAFIAYCV